MGRSAKEVPGGTAYYSSLALKRLGLDVVVVTKAAEEDRGFLLRELDKAQITVVCREGGASTSFENVYTDGNPDLRVQRIKAVGTPFSSDDLEGISTASYHVGPLTSRDISVDLLEALSARASIVSLDVQGMLRAAHEGTVREMDWPEKRKALPCVDILKADEKEAKTLSGEATEKTAAVAISLMGPSDVLVTMGSRGSWVYGENTLHEIPSFEPKRRGDPTGCGDTYAAGYLYQRLKGKNPEQAGRFAAAIASLKLEGDGPFDGTESEVHACLSTA
jgi:sugar/nucleoside kinase (ribokinase family)